MSEFDEQAARLGIGAVDVLPDSGLAKRLEAGRPLRIKLGIDPTAPDIHLGHVVVLEKLRQFQAAGHVAVLIIGDYTARVGDPSGRSSLRPDLDAAQIEANAKTFTNQAFKVLDPELTEVRYNSEWLEMPSGELFAISKRFTVARLLERDDFQKRMATAQPISALEMLYPILQGYDSVAVKADVELGATEQRFNLLFGRDVQEAYAQKPQIVMMLPILPGTDGIRKMSKSLDNYVGVTEEPAEIFGKLMSVPDEAMASYWTLLLGEELDGTRHPAEAKRDLARHICERFGGSGAGEAAEAAFDRIHVERGVPADLDEIGVDDGPVHLPALLAEQFGFSRGEARRMLSQGAVRIDGEAAPSDELDIDAEALRGRVLQVGKRRFVKVSENP